MSSEGQELPPGWVRIPLSAISHPSKQKLRPAEFGTRLYVGLEHIEPGSGRLSGYGNATEVKSAKSVFNAGDTLYGKLRPYLKKVCRPEFDGICSTDILVYPSTKSLDSRFLLGFLLQDSTAAFAVQNSSGINLPRIGAAKLGEISIPMPPLSEQERIAEAITSLRERTEQARSSLDEVSALVHQLRQSVLQKAFTGALTKGWREANPSIEPAAELLARIRSERRKRWEEAELAKFEAKKRKPPINWQTKYTEPAPIDDSNLPELPSDWCWTSLPMLGEMGRGKSKHRPRNAEHLFGGPYPFIQTGDIARTNGQLEDFKQTYNEKGLTQSKLWPEGTVCITIAANIASSAILSFQACFPDSVVGIVPDQAVCSSELIEYFIRTAKENLDRFAPATAQKNINLATLSALAFPLPPLKESAQLVRLIGEAMSRIDAIENAVSLNLDALESLDQAILAKAFRGELVPQDPNDEPASDLLARIATSD